MPSKKVFSWLKRKPRSTVQPEGSVSALKPISAKANTPQGLEVVFEGDNPVVDIVAVHGLNGHREKTWTAANKVHWLRDLLPYDLPPARIMCWGYDANTHDRSRMSCQYLYDYAQSLVSDLCRKRRLTDSWERPIIFVAHSLGGIIVKSALIHSDASRQGALLEHRSIKLSTHGIIFMGTPHQGGNGVHLGQLLVNVASLFVAADDHILQHLRQDSEWLQQQLGQYGPISNDFVTKYAYEEYETLTKFGRKILVVPRASAVVPGHADGEPIAIHADHINMVKFASKHDNGYVTVSETLQIMMRDAGDRTQLRWKEEARIVHVRTDPTYGRWFLPLNLSGVHQVTRFVAREEELAKLHQILLRKDKLNTAIIHGLGGMGKTQLTVAYIQRHHKDYSAVLWLNAKDETSLKQSHAYAAERILRQHPSMVYVQNAVRGKDVDQITHAVKRWLEEPRNDNWLVVYDNYDNLKFQRSPNGLANEGRYEYETTDSQASTDRGFDIRSFFPESQQGAIIVTTRSTTVKLGEMVALEKLKNIDDSLKILAMTSQRQVPDKDAGAEELARRLDGLPLALSTAGSYLSQVSTSWAEYLELYEKSWLRLQKLSPQLLDYHHAMYSTWDISYRHIERDDQNAAKLLQLWAYFDNEDLWFELLYDGASISEGWLHNTIQDRLSFDTAMRVLCNHGLVEANMPTEKWGTQSCGYSVHECVHSWMTHVLNKETDKAMFWLAAKCVASHTPDEDVEEYWVIQRRLLRHADQFQTTLSGSEVLKSHEWILHGLGFLYANQGHLKDAECMYNRALQGFEKAWGREHTPTLHTVKNLGLVYQNQGRLREAKVMYNRALQGFEKACGSEHASTLNILNYLGDLYCDQGRLKEAEDMYNRALQGFEKARGPTHTSALNTVMRLGSLYCNQSRLKEAEDMYNRSLQGYEKEYGPKHTYTLKAFNNLGNLFSVQGRLDEAEDMYNRALQGKEKAWGPEHTFTLDTVNNLGNLYKCQGRLREAEETYNRALQGFEKAIGTSAIKTYPLALITLENLGDLSQRIGKAEKAQECWTQAAEGVRLVYGPTHWRCQRISMKLKYKRSSRRPFEDRIV